MFTKKFFKTKDECEVTFELNVENAEQVVLVSEHNGWEPIDMKQAKNGRSVPRCACQKMASSSSAIW